MKSVLIYYTMTGNTKKIAQAIHRGMSEPGEQCDIVRLQEAYAKELFDVIDVTFREIFSIGLLGTHRKDRKTISNIDKDCIR